MHWLHEILSLKLLFLFLLRHSLSVPSFGANGKMETGSREGLLVIPGLGRPDRLDTVLSSLQVFSHKLLGRNATWDCVVYIYTPREWKVLPDSIWYQKKKLEELQSLCDMIENPNKKVTENLHMIQPALIRHSYQYVFVLLDDCQLQPSQESSQIDRHRSGSGVGEFDIDRILAVMETNELTVASPFVSGANKGGGQQFRNIMQTPAQSNTEGYVSTFLELFAWIMTMPAYEALWQLLYPSINPYGWGYDLWYDNYAKRRVVGHKMGVVSNVRAFHQQDLAITNRTDDTSPDTKWKALVFQERHYQTYYGVTLHKYRETMDLKNMSWNGAVVGYLQAPNPQILATRRQQGKRGTKRSKKQQKIEAKIVNMKRARTKYDATTLSENEEGILM